MYLLLKLLALLPISGVMAKWNFSSLKRLKIYLRNTSETRFNDVASLFIHRDIHVNDEEVLIKLASVSKNLDFVSLRFFFYNQNRVNKFNKVYSFL